MYVVLLHTFFLTNIKYEKMKKLISFYRLAVVLFALALTGCDNKEDLSIIEKDIPTPVLNKYATVVSGPKDEVATEVADIESTVGSYTFYISAITTESGEDLLAKKDLFTIDEKTGRISIKSTNKISASELALGIYNISVGVHYLGGTVTFDNIASIEIIELPFTIAYSTNPISVAFGQMGEFATVTVTSDDENLVVENYTLTEAPEGIEINSETGAISKVSKNVPAGAHDLSVRVVTNQGTKNFNNTLQIQVGEKPQLYYTNNSTQFSSVSISSWSGFTASVAGGVDDLGTGLSFALDNNSVNGLSINATTGNITLAEDSNLAEGNHNVGITVTDESGFEVNYPNLFTIQVANSWEQIAFDDLDVSAYADKEARAVNDQFSYYETVMLNSTAIEFVSYKHIADPTTGFLAYGLSYNFGKTISIDASLVREVPMDGSFRKMKVAFDETSVAKIQGDNVQREFFYGYDRIELVDNANFVADQWNLLIGANSDQWAVNNYKTGFKTIETEFEISDPAQEKLYLQWKVTSTTPATGFTRGSYNGVRIQVMKKSTPVFS